MKWHDEEKDKLRGLYKGSTWYELLAAFPGRTKQAIYSAAHDLGLCRYKWELTEIHRLRDMYSEATPYELMETFPRHTYETIKKRAELIGVKKLQKELPCGTNPIIKVLYKERHRKQKLSRDIAKLSGISQETFRLWERGVVEPKLDKLQKWAVSLGFEIIIRKIPPVLPIPPRINVTAMLMGDPPPERSAGNVISEHRETLASSDILS